MQHIHGPNCGCAEYGGVQFSTDLLPAIKIQQVTCLNENLAGSGKGLFRPFEQRHDRSRFVTSSCDGEVLLVIPFSNQVKIKSVCIVAKDENHSPIKLRIFTNIEHIDFSLTQSQPIQEFMIGPNLDAEQHWAVKPSKFSSVFKLILHLQNSELEHIQISYVQIKGEDTKIKREPVIAVYQIQPVAQTKKAGDMVSNLFTM